MSVMCIELHTAGVRLCILAWALLFVLGGKVFQNLRVENRQKYDSPLCFYVPGLVGVARPAKNN